MLRRNSKPVDVMRAAFYSLWGVLTLVLLFTVGFLVYRLAQREEQTAVGLSVARGPARTDGATADASGHPVSLYFADRPRVRLVPEERVLPTGQSTVENCRIAFEALAAGPRMNGVATLPPTSRARAMYLLSTGELVVDLTRDVENPAIRSASAEWLLIQSVVHTLAQPALQGTNDRPVVTVLLLYEGSPTSEGFPSHIVLGEPMRPDALLVDGG